MVRSDCGNPHPAKTKTGGGSARAWRVGSWRGDGQRAASTTLPRRPETFARGPLRDRVSRRAAEYAWWPDDNEAVRPSDGLPDRIGPVGCGPGSAWPQTQRPGGALDTHGHALVPFQVAVGKHASEKSPANVACRNRAAVHCHPRVFGCFALSSLRPPKHRRTSWRRICRRDVAPTLTRAFGWQQLLDRGVAGSGMEIAQWDGMHRFVVNELLRLSLP